MKVKESRDLIGSYLVNIGKIKLLTKEAEIELASLCLQGDLAAREKLIQANLRWVVKIAAKHQHRGVPMEDLIGYGNEGLIRATKTFDPARGYKFSTYAYWWIRQSITHAIATSSRTIGLPTHIVETLNQLKKVEKATGSNLRDIAIGWLTMDLRVIEIAKLRAEYQLANETGKEKIIRTVMKRIREIQGFNRNPLSFSYPIGKDKKQEMEDLVAGEINIEEEVERGLNKERVWQLVDKLEPKQRRVIVERFGLEGEAKKLNDIGKDMGVSRERIRQIESSALRTLRVFCVKS